MNTKPQARPKMKAADVLKELSAFDLKGFPVKVLGIRNYYGATVGLKGNDRGLYDDAIFVVGPNGEFAGFKANTDPSIQKPGIAMLVAPQVVYYKPGIHGISGKNPRPAFRQDSRVTVMRDGKSTPFKDTAAMPFWINIHDGGNNTTSSEGCQTIIKSQWEEFRDLVNKLLKENNQSRFPYVLIEYK